MREEGGNVKTYTIVKTRRGVQTSTTGTVVELAKYFGYTLECGHSYDARIKRIPKTAKSLVSALNASVAETQRGSFDPNSYALADTARPGGPDK